MSSGSAVNVGTLQGVLEMRDLFTAQMDKFEARLKMVEEKAQRASKSTKTETDKVSEAYKKVAASLDPVIAKQQKLEQATKTLESALKKGLITQEDYNKKLSDATAKYSDTSSAAAKSASELTKVENAYKRVASSLDPVAAKSLKYEAVVATLDRALAKGVITQQKYNETLDKAKEKYLTAGATLDGYGKKLAAFGTQASSIGGQLTRTLTVPLAGLGIASAKSSTDLNRSLANVSALLTDLSGSQLDSVVGQMKDKIRSLSVDLGKSTTDMADGLYEVISSLGYTNDTFSQLEISARAGAAGLASTKDAFNFLSAVTKTYGDTSEEAFKKVADLGFQAVNLGQTTFPQLSASIGGVAPIAQAAGVSLEELFAVIATSTGVTGNTAEVTTQMGSALTGLLNPSKDLNILYRSLGISSGEAMIQQYGFVGSLQKIAEYADKAGIPLAELLGRKEAFVITASLAGAQAEKFASNLDSMGRAANANGKIVTDAFAKQTQGVNKAGFAWEQFKARTQVAFQTLGDSIVPVLMSVMDSLKPLFSGLESLIGWFGKLPQPVKTSVVVLAGIATVAGPVVYVIGQMASALGSIILIAPSVASAATVIAGGFKAISASLLGLPALLIGVGIAANAMINKWKEDMGEAVAQMTHFQTQADNFLTIRGQLTAATSAGIIDIPTLQAAAVQYGNIKRDLIDIQKKLPEAERKARDEFNMYAKKQNQEELDSLKNNIAQQQARLTLLDALLKKTKDLKRVEDESKKKDKDTPTLPLSDDQKTALDNALKSIEALRRQAEQMRSQAQAAREGLKSLQDRREAQEADNAVTEISIALGEHGLSLSSAQESAIRSYINTIQDSAESVRISTKVHQELEAITLRLSGVMNRMFAQMAGDSDPAMKALLDKLKLINEQARELADKRIKFEFDLDDINAATSAIIKGGDALVEYERNTKILSDALALVPTPEVFTLDYQGQWLADLERAKAAISLKIDAELALSFKDSLKKPEEELKSLKIVLDRLRETTDATGKSLLSASEAEEIYARKVSEVQSNFWDENLSNWSSALNYLADEFGGFFKYLSQAVQTLQQAKGMSDSVSGISSAMGASSGAAAAMGAFGAYLVIAKAMYDAFKAHVESRQSRQYNVGAVFSKDAGQDWNTPIEKQGQAVSHQIQRTAEAFAEALGGTIRTFVGLQVDIRRDGKYFAAFVGREMIGHFQSMEEAVSAALLEAFKHVETEVSGISELVKSGFKYLTSDAGDLNINNLEDAGIFLTSLREISELTWSNGASTTLEFVRHLDTLWATLQKLGNATPDVIQGFNDLIATEVRSWQAWSDSITGREKSKAELLAEKKQDAILFEAQKKFRIAELELKRVDLQAQIAILLGQQKIINTGNKVKQGELEVNKSFLVAKASLMGAELTLNEQYIAALQAQIDAIGAVIVALANIPTINPDDIKLPNAGGGAGGQRQAVRDWVKDRKYDLDTRSLDEWAKKAADISRQYDEQIEQAGKDSKLRAELIALKERELELLKKEQIDSVVNSFKDFLGLVSPFDQVRQTAEDLIKQIEASPLGNDRKAKMIGRVLADVDRQLQNMSDQMTAGLFGDLAGMMEDGVQKTALLRAQFILNFQLQLADAKARFALLVAEGKLNETNKKIIEDALKILEGYDPGSVFDNGQNGGNGGSGTPSGNAYTAHMDAMAQANEAYIKRMQTARDLLKKYTDQGIDPLTRRIREINADFVTIAAALGNTPAIIQEHNEALAEAYRDATSGIRDFYNDLLNGPASAGTIEQQFNAAQADYNRILAEIQGGNYTNLESFDSVAQNFIDLLGQMYGTSTGGFQDIRAQVLEQLRQILSLGGNTAPVQTPASGANSGAAASSSSSSSGFVSSASQYANNVLTFPPQLVDTTRAGVDATKNVADVINIRSGRQEVLLKKLVDLVDSVDKKMDRENINLTPEVGYGRPIK